MTESKSSVMSTFKTTLSSIPQTIQKEASDVSGSRNFIYGILTAPLVIGASLFTYKKIKTMKRCPFNFKKYNDQSTNTTTTEKEVASQCSISRGK